MLFSRNSLCFSLSHSVRLFPSQAYISSYYFEKKHIVFLDRQAFYTVCFPKDFFYIPKHFVSYSSVFDFFISCFHPNYLTKNKSVFFLLLKFLQKKNLYTKYFKICKFKIIQIINKSPQFLSFCHFKNFLRWKSISWWNFSLICSYQLLKKPNNNKMCLRFMIGLVLSK